MRRVIPAAILLIVSAIVLVRTGHAGVQTTDPAVRERAYREINIGVGRLEQFEYRDAAASFGRAIAIDPALAIAHVDLAIASLYDSQLETADREAALAADAMPSAPQPPYVRGLVARAGGRDSDAAGWFRRVLALDPADVGGRIQLGQVLIANREYA